MPPICKPTNSKCYKRRAVARILNRFGYGMSFFSVLFIIAIVCCILVRAVSDQTDDLWESQSLHIRTGNEPAASDVYGLGVRVGVYLQVAGMLLSTLGGRTGGITIAVAGTMLGIMASWTVLAARRSFSPCESYVILILLNMLCVVGVALNPRPSIVLAFEGFIFWLTWVWVIISTFWFWSTLMFRLPLFGTYNYTWFFARIALDGGYRIWVLIMLSLSTPISVICLLAGGVSKDETQSEPDVEGRSGHIPAGEPESTNRDDPNDSSEHEKDIRPATLSVILLSSPTMIMAVASIEKTIVYNALEPETDLSLPGQTIPLAIGLIVLLCGCKDLVHTFCGSNRKAEAS